VTYVTDTDGTLCYAPPLSCALSGRPVRVKREREVQRLRLSHSISEAINDSLMKAWLPDCMLLSRFAPYWTCYSTWIESRFCARCARVAVAGMRLLVSARWPAGRLWGRTPAVPPHFGVRLVTDFSLESVLLSPAGQGIRALRAARHPPSRPETARQQNAPTAPLIACR
jgi:hypothetical protein